MTSSFAPRHLLFALFPLFPLFACGQGKPATSPPPSDAGGGETSAHPCGAALFCDDFESYPTGSPPGGGWTTSQNGGTVVVDDSRVYGGKRAVKVSSTGTAAFRSVLISLQDESFLPPAGNVLYGRMMFWLDSAPTTMIHWTFIDTVGLVPGTDYHAVYRYGGQIPVAAEDGGFLGSQLLANYDTPDSYDTPPIGPSSDCWVHAASDDVVPVAAWTCAEWEFDGSHDTMHFWKNGTALADLTMTGTGQGCVSQPATFPWTAPTLAQVDLGWESYQADGPRTIWIDDVAIGSERIGCPAP
jgi:hypothetical protein